MQHILNTENRPGFSNRPDQTASAIYAACQMATVQPQRVPTIPLNVSMSSQLGFASAAWVPDRSSPIRRLVEVFPEVKVEAPNPCDLAGAFWSCPQRFLFYNNLGQFICNMLGVELERLRPPLGSLSLGSLSDSNSKRFALPASARVSRILLVGFDVLVCLEVPRSLNE